MTEHDWLTATDPTPMLDFLQRSFQLKLSDRKMRLLAVASCRRLDQIALNTQSKLAVECAEQFADGLVTAEELQLAFVNAEESDSDKIPALRDWSLQRTENERNTDARNSAASDLGYAIRCTAAPEVPLIGILKRLDLAASNLVFDAWDHPAYTAYCIAQDRERIAQAALIRCIFGNPFHPVTVDPRWQTETVVALAAGIYEDRAFERMPILADALQEAGCENEQVLSHCREPGQHVRGCWVVDLLLGKQ